MHGLNQQLVKQEEENEEKGKNTVLESPSDGRPKVRKTLSGRIIGYRGMDPPLAFSSITGENDGENVEGNVSENVGEEVGGVELVEESLSRVELEMIEYEKIKAAKRKKGTLKKNYKPTPVVLSDDSVEEEV